MNQTDTYCGAPNCGRPSPAGTICEGCFVELSDLIERLPWALSHLRNAATNQVRFTTGGGSRSTETPLMFNPKASLELSALEATIAMWQARLADHMCTPVRFPNATQAAHWMFDHLSEAHTFIDAGKMLDSFEFSRKSIEKTLNRPPERTYLGDCTTNDEGHVCPGRMYSFPEEPEARCDLAGHTSDAAELRLKLLRGLDDRVLTASEIARMATYMGLTIDRTQVRKRINQWHSRKRIIAHDHVGDAPRFKFLEVRLMLEQDEASRQTA